MTNQRHHTVRDLLRTALPMGTHIVAGQKGIGKPVAWTAVLQTRPPAFPSLEGRELALVAMDALHLLNDKLTLGELIHDLAQMDVSAIGVVGSIDMKARQTAENHAIALLSLPGGTALRHVERDVVKVLLGPPPSAQQRGLEIHQQLLQLSTENRGMSALINAIVEASGQSVVVQDKRLEAVVSSGPIADSPNWAAIATALTDEEALPAVFRNRVEVAQLSPEPALIDMPEFGIRRLVVPIVANRMGRGFFSLLTERNNFDALDIQYARQGAAVCAIEMAKEKAVREAQKRVQGSIVERLLFGTIAFDQAQRQLARLGHDPENQPYTALAACWGAEKAPSERRLETLFNEQVSAMRGCRALVQLLEGGVVVFCADDAATSPRTVPRMVKQLAMSITERVNTDYPQSQLSLGIGRPISRLAEWRNSYREALAAQHIALQWHVDQPLYFGDLGVYRLLSLLLENPELDHFYRETLGDLSDERYANDEFIVTLETFFEEHGNLSQTANKLHVHRNTLLYRMERIAQIGSFDLDNPETRLAVHLALKIRRLVAMASRK